MAQPLLPLKLTPPPLRKGVLLRPDLQALLAEVRLHPLALVVAPAGFGKTTLISQWVQELLRTGAPVCWLTLDSNERDPAMFLAYLIRAFQTADPTIGEQAWRVLHSAANLERDWPLVAGALCSDLQRQLATATFLILDDLHLASESAVIGQVLGYILRAAPPTLHIVMATRRAPTFPPLARLRTEGQIIELSQRDLHLSPTEARQILAVQGVSLSEQELALLLTRTEGWVLSVQLAARALANQPAERRGDFLSALAGSQEQLLSYLSSEVLADLPEELIGFLQLAALPERFDADLLADVLQRDDVTYLLRRGQALGLPILPLDERGHLLRFHPLWRELLLRPERLPQSLDQGRPGQINQHTPLIELHRRFGRAFEARGDLEAALDHYARAGADDDLARALRQRAWPLLQSPRRDIVRRWVEQLPASLRENDADLLYMWGYSQIVADPQQAMTTIERAADHYRQSGRFDRELRAYSDLATLLFWQVRPADFVAICLRGARAAHHVGDAWSRGAARVCAAAILYTKGRALAALRVARQATAEPLSPAWHWLLAMIVSEINIQLGRPAEALDAIDEALQLPQVDHDDRLRQNLLRQRAMALYEQGQLADAIALALDAHRRLGDYYRDGTAAFSAAQLALLLTLQGRIDEATTYVTQARTAFHDLGALAPLAMLQTIELFGMFQRGQAARAAMLVSSALRRLVEAEGHPPDLRMRLLLAMVLGEGEEPQRALALAKDTARHMRAQGYRLFLASAQLYSAYLAGLDGDQAARQEALREGWSLVIADNHCFLPMLPLAALRDVALAALRGLAGEPASAGAEPRRRKAQTPAAPAATPPAPFDSDQLRVAVGRVLSVQAPDQASELAQSLIADPDAAIRERAARLLGQVGATGAYPSLRGLLKDRSAAVRQAAEESLSRLIYQPPYTLRIRTLGAFLLWRGDQEVRDRDWRSSKARQLFQLLLTERGRMLPRERILDLLWPEMDLESAANNLRVTLNRLTKAIEPDRPEGVPPAFLSQQGDTYGFNTASRYTLDAADFDAAVTEGQRADQHGQRQPAITAFRRAAALYGGPYLPDSMYEDWTVVERERLALRFNDAALRLGALLLDEGLHHESIGLAWRVLENDHTHEDAYRLLIRAHASLGERSTALRLYTRCITVLREELGVEPLPETIALYQALREAR